MVQRMAREEPNASQFLSFIDCGLKIDRILYMFPYLLINWAKLMVMLMAAPMVAAKETLMASNLVDCLETPKVSKTVEEKVLQILMVCLMVSSMD